MDKGHPLCQRGRFGLAISPLLQSLYLEYCAELVPEKACRLLNRAFGIERLADDSQAYRLIHRYGCSTEVEGSLREPLHAAEMKPGAGCGEEGEAVYAMFDGGMLPYDEGYCEVKVGRVFLESQVVPQGPAIEGSTKRNRVLNSEYLMREGHYASFTARFGELLDAYMRAHPGAPLVFITDGAKWMQDWVSEKYPDAIHILDFWHAYERLCDFGAVLWRCPKARHKGLDAWKAMLMDGKAEQIIKELEGYKAHARAKVAEAVEPLLVYFEGKKHRMRYDEYLQQGYMIGSGAIESAVRSAMQQRCKLSGQRWGNGAQAVLNIRAMYLSGKGARIEKFITKHYHNAA
jgi:hypothetical protein